MPLIMDGIVSRSYWASEASPTLGCSIEISRDWASEASPTLGCSIEISRDIYMYICVSVVCQITWNHVNQTRACSKSVLGGTPVLFVSTIR